MILDDLFPGAAHACLAGVDEVGRGCLAGPVTAAAVILDPNIQIDGLNDSKKLTHNQRNALSIDIMNTARDWSIGWASVTEIDRVNILQATFLAMQRAVKGLTITPEIIVVDGNQQPDFGQVPTATLIGGDGLIDAISAASIIAKTSRDRLMTQWDTLYPQYHFARNKGYPSVHHRQAIITYGTTIVHRHSFRVSKPKT